MSAVSNMIFALAVATSNVQGAGGDPIRIVIAGGTLPTPITLTDPAIMARFKVGVGPGTFELARDGARITNFESSMIVDWKRGIATPPKGLPMYEVSFAIPRRGTYFVFYAIDPATKHGYVYFPGAGDPHYESNISMIYRQIEGNRFHAWSAWEDVAHPLIVQVLAGR
jgi:hypothetical protein